MSSLWAVADVAKAVGVKTTTEFCQENLEFGRVEIDSRKVQAGDLFIAIKGENFDGHDFVTQAFANGAITAIVERKLPCGGNQIIVPNAQKALDDLAKYNRARSAAKIIGITGSVGKTSTKEMLRIALSEHGKVHATSGNYNNHIGTPLNLANMPLNADFGVFEMGMNHMNEISHLTKMVRPDVAIITNVEPAHLEFFASVAEIAIAKAEIFEGVASGGAVILNANNDFCEYLKTKSTTLGLKTFLCGKAENLDCQALDYTPFPSGCDVKIKFLDNEEIICPLSVTGEHWAQLLPLVLMTVKTLNLDIKKSIKNLTLHFAEQNGRGKQIPIVINKVEVLVVDDSYNASPTSMKAAIAKTAELWKTRGQNGRKIAVLGDMLELGEKSQLFHEDVAKTLQEYEFHKVFASGKLMKYAYDGLPDFMKGGYCATSMELLPIVKDALHEYGDVVLIKGSHGSKMYELAEEIMRGKN